MQPRLFFWINLRSIHSSIKWLSRKFFRMEVFSSPMFSISKLTMLLPNSGKQLEFKPLCHSVVDIQLSFQPHIPCYQVSKTWLPPPKLPDSHSHKLKPCSMLPRMPQLLLLAPLLPRRTMPQPLKTRNRKKKKMLTWAIFSVEMMNTIEERQ